MTTIAQRIAEELSVQEAQIIAAVTLLDGGATVPFIARYRKEATQGLDDSQLRTLEERLRYLRELDERRDVIINSIREQEKLTAELEAALHQADTKTRLEDLYLPYKPKRRTKAQIAKEAGLEPLAEALFSDPTLDPEQSAHIYLDADKGVADTKQALDGARQILMERFAEDAELLPKLRDHMWDASHCQAKVVEGKENEGAKFADYFEYDESLKDLPSHRALALFRGRNEGILQLSMSFPDEQDLPLTALGRCEAMLTAHHGIADKGRAADKWLLDTARWAWRFKIRLSLEAESLLRIRELAEAEAINVFARNLNDLLLAAPAGQRATLGLDPGLRSGVKVAVVDNTGKFIAHDTIYPHVPQKKWEAAIASLAKLAKQYDVELISIGNGTASRETDKLAADLISRHPELKLNKIMVSEAGASVYSASEFAAQEFPDLDVSIRGAVSIARRLQDPLAELVKIDPKSIGVGQYQHDVSQTKLARSLDAVVEDCVNAVGVDVNTASAPLLSRVSGLNAGLARNVVQYRDAHGAFSVREDLKNVTRLGAKTFEQAAGFLRISNGDNPLDVSSVHPEAYPLVERILQKNQRTIKQVLGDHAFLTQLSPKDYTDEIFGIPTVTDIIKELDKPGRDPRPEFKTAAFKEGVEKLADLKADMILEGVVTNVTNFGAFVDVGVHQDGLVHISALSDKFISDPREIVKAGDVVKVKVIDIDLARRRVALTMRLEQKSAEKGGDKNTPKNASQKSKKPRSQNNNKPRQKDNAPPNGAFADAFANAFAKQK